MRLADRHLRVDGQGVLAPADAIRPGRVLLSVDTGFASVPAGQHLVWLLSSLLARQFLVVSEVLLQVPDVPVRRYVRPFGRAETLPAALIECIGLVGGGHVRARLVSERVRDVVDVHLVLGDAQPHRGAKEILHLFGVGWRWYVGRIPLATSPPAQTELSIGPHLAACFGAGEVFKRLRGMRVEKGHFIDQLFGSAWTMETSSSWDQLTDGPDANDIKNFGHVYFAGAGAVAQAAALSVATSRFSGRGSAIDFDTFDLTNDNRYVLSHLDNDGDLKIDILGDYLSANDVPCAKAPVKWEEFVAARGALSKDAEVSRLERDFRYPLVLSCVDKNVVRHAIQNVLPRLVLGGSTDGLTARITAYDLGSGGGCLKCFNRIENRNEVVQHRLEQARAMSSDARRDFCLELGIAMDDLDRLLAEPKCGKLGESDLERFARSLPEMSVGFVSAASGILLAAQLIRISMLGLREVMSRGEMLCATFSRPALRHYRLPVDATCNCQAHLKKAWREMWND